MPSDMADYYREIDAKIAVEIMGWRWFLAPDASGQARTVLYPPDDGAWISWNRQPNARDVTDSAGEYERFSDWDRCVSPANDRGKLGMPRFSMDLGAAMEYVWPWVYEQTTEHWPQGAAVSLTQHSGGLWEASVSEDEEGEPLIETEAFALPAHAICDTALKIKQGLWLRLDD